jgi:protein-S-isoprenylcysteine O-methyltransferase Ste14
MKMKDISKLFIPTLRTFLIGGIALGVLLFLPAWTLNYWQAWVFIVVFDVSTNIIGIYLSIKDPELLDRRKKVGVAAEERTAQKFIVVILAIACTALLVFPAFDHRFAWSLVPWYVSVAGDALVALGLLLTLPVLKENRYAASTIQTFADQKVISSGLYAIVRHPMYAGNLVMIIGVPLALGSWWGLAIVVLTLPVLIWRILDEEKLLRENLPGYIEYTRKVRYRLVPYLW